MSDKKVRIATPRIISPDEAQAEQADDLSARRKPRLPGDKLAEYVTRREMIDGCANAALAVGEKMYDQLSGETAEHLEQMERVITARVLQLVEQRTLRYRLRARYFRIREHVVGYLIALGALSPFTGKPELRIVDAAEALDPNAQAAVKLREEGLLLLRAKLATAEGGDEIELPPGATVEDMYAIDRELHPDIALDEAPAPEPT